MQKTVTNIKRAKKIAINVPMSYQLRCQPHNFKRTVVGQHSLTTRGSPWLSQSILATSSSPLQSPPLDVRHRVWEDSSRTPEDSREKAKHSRDGGVAAVRAQVSKHELKRTNKN